MKDELSIQQEIFNNPVMDYFSLRQESIRQLQRLTGSEWTDFNEHDPGITILEQFCYALTDFAYRCDFDLPDLLSRDGKNPYASLHSAAQVLTSRPVTLLDLRKLVVDVRGVKNAWIEKIDHIALPNEDIKQNPNKLLQLHGNESLESVNLKGLYKVLIEKSDILSVDNAEIIRNVARRLHTHRPLCMDFDSVEIMGTQKIQVKTSIEIDSVANPEGIYVEILEKLTTHISPNIPFYTLAQRQAADKRIDEIFDGPMLDQGFIDSGELLGMKRKTALRVSDFIRAIMEVEGVIMVKYLALNGGGQWQNWWLDLAKEKTPILDIEKSVLSLEKGQIEVSLDYKSAKARYGQAQTNLAYRPARPEEMDIQVPVGRNRNVGRYYSMQHQFPNVYGLGNADLSLQSSAMRQAQVRQLKAYLLFFDQLLANQFTQLAHVGDLLGFDSDDSQTYYTAEINDATLRLDAIWQQKNTQHKTEQQIDWARKNRFLDHLLARFAEQFTDYAQFLQGNLDTMFNARKKALADKQTWLRNYPQLSSDRGTGFNTLLPWNANLENRSGLEQRLRIKLGLNEDDHFYLLEHILLRPFDADKGQQPIPLLVDARCIDPYSLQISLIFSNNSERFQKDGTFRRFVEQTIREEIPVHLLVYVRWLEKSDMVIFEKAYKIWQNSQCTLREDNDEKRLQSSKNKNLLSFSLRDARDRIIDLLAIGNTNPIADLLVEYTATVAWGQSGKITLIASQDGVLYQLFSKNSGAALDENNKPIETYGNGSNVELLTPKITKDIDFLIKASKLYSNRSIQLFQTINIKVGLDTSLQAMIVKEDTDLLDTSIANPAVTEPRIVAYGATPHIEIQLSQAGVEYRLMRVQESIVDADYVLQDSKTQLPIALKGIPKEPHALGDSHSIILQTVPAQEDTDIRILAIKSFTEKENQAEQQALLDVTLPLKVRANPALSFTVTQSLLNYQAETEVIIKESQASVSYQVCTRAILDSEFIRDQNNQVISIDGIASLWVANPPNPTPDLNFLGVPTVGNGGNLKLSFNDLTEDSLVVIRATKTHKTQNNKPFIASSIQLTQASAVLVRPGDNSHFPLYLKAKEVEVSADGLKKDVVYIVQNGQPGVFYYFRLASDTKELGLPVYFHKVGKGIEQLQVEIDFTITGNSPTPPPEWDCPVDLEATAILSIRAVKAQTGLETIFQITVADLLKQPDLPA